MPHRGLVRPPGKTAQGLVASTFQVVKKLRWFRRRHTNEGGFTIVEALIYLVIAGAVVGSVYQVLIGQNRLYMKQRELMDVRGSLKSAGALLAWELRQSAAAEGDFYSIGQNAVALRSFQGSGVICGEHAALLRYGLWGTSGEFDTTADDSALVLASGGNLSGADDSWSHVKIEKTFSPAPLGGVPNCFWGDSSLGKGKGENTAKGGKCGKGTGCTGVPDLVVEIKNDDSSIMDGVYMGAPFRAFRRVEYGLYAEDGRWWLGRKIGGAGSYEKLAGPLLAPSDSGLVFTYYDQAGSVTANPLDVAMVELILRAESYGNVAQGGPMAAQQDSLTLRVFLRG